MSRRTQRLAVAIFTSGVLIAFASWRRGHAFPVPAAAFDGAAAVICVGGECYGRLRHKACRRRSAVTR